jgi:hypothetical protein
MPTSAGAIRAQQSRWEGGRADLLRDWTVPLVATGMRRRDPVRLHAWFELLVAPQSMLVLLHLGFGVTALVARTRWLRRLAALDGALQAVFVLGGLRLTRAPRSVYRALVGAPVLIVQKVRLLSGLLVKGAPRTWERTPRDEVHRPPDRA